MGVPLVVCLHRHADILDSECMWNPMQCWCNALNITAALRSCACMAFGMGLLLPVLNFRTECSATWAS